MFSKVDSLAVDTIRMLSLDQVEEAGAGHPGAPLDQAPMAHALWTKHLRVNPTNPKWFNRDRFVLSSGHGSPLIYSLLHLAGFNLSIDDLKHFRKFNSKTPGHPEVTHTEGVEATTGPLGQGVANAVGMAMAEAHLAAMFNRDNYNVVDHYTYTICGDGDLQEGVCQEASSLAGHLKLGKLIVLYDSNDVQLDGPTNMGFTEDIEMKYKAYGWHYQRVEDGNDMEAINKAIEKAKAETDKPSIIEIKTIIGYGMPNAGTSDAHSDPIGAEGVAYTKKQYHWTHDEPFYVPDEVYNVYKENVENRGSQAEEEWNKLFKGYQEAYPELAEELSASIRRELPDNWADEVPNYEVGDSESTRDTSSRIINGIAEKVSTFWGGSADLSNSNKTMIKSAEAFTPDNYEGRNIWYGVREFAMGAILNGILLHGGTWSYVGTFFVFSDYLRPAIRLAALSQIPAIYVFTHDSVILGFDGATHEPIEHFASYRAMPNLTTFRPADANEAVAAWKFAMESEDRPTILALSRQALPVLEGTVKYAQDHVEKGGYVISPAESKDYDGIIIASGSEVSLSIEVQKQLKEDGIDVSVVSIPSTDLFDLQSDEYKEAVLPSKIEKRLVVEASNDPGWAKYYGSKGKALGIETFGISGDGQEVYESFGYTVDKIVEEYKTL
ncbi:transketolase [Aerococcus urinae]|uniref:Transketolase n=1 Tax=Aerococcus mictus TaxID=2976810 RepID=A0ABZ2ECC5_9LACT|nr:MULTISPECIES: transketolase [Aerococcus]KAA9290295.1 transketolase [Aerococcus mictus]MBU5611209.1 transketolase [Aerococcus urinae]MDK6291791.1 transketolase [Aerococcus urinae]MDK6450318.1 transketolase [Aerococcus urinae]MDK6474334.1 transketolase [Aerococcus urinae]